MYFAIKESALMPSVKIHSDEHRIVVSGQSRLEDPTLFYEELITLLDDKINEFRTQIFVDFKLNYLNSNSSKWLFHMLKNMQNKYNGKKLITVNWYFEADDESMEEAGEIFQSLLNIPFNIIKMR